MSKIKIVFYLVLAFVAYKGFVAFKDFEIGVGDRVAQLEELADFEKKRRGNRFNDVFRRPTRVKGAFTN